MNYTYQDANGQLTFSETPNQFLMIPSTLIRFSNSVTTTHKDKTGRKILKISGTLDLAPDERRCPKCGGRMHVNDHFTTKLSHLVLAEVFAVFALTVYNFSVNVVILRCRRFRSKPKVIALRKSFINTHVSFFQPETSH